MTPTDEQLAAVAAARQGSDSLMLSAYAGCAKSSTLELMAPQIREPALALAFNKKIAAELAERLPSSFASKTLNGLGHGAWLRANPQITSVKLDDRKLGKIISDQRPRPKGDLFADVLALARQAQIAGLVPAGAGPPGLIPDTPEGWASLPSDLDGEDLDEIADLAREALREDIALARRGILSFDDQIYCPTLLGGKWGQYPVVFVDESQDLSPLNHRQLQLVLRPSGRLVAVGDQRQAIYRFRGADAESMINLRRLAPQWTDLPLTMTFRCPKAIVARQQSHAPGYRAWPGGPEGRIERWVGAPWGASGIRRLITDLRDRGWNTPLAVLCRNVAPLMKLAFRLLRQNVGVSVAGRDIGRSLIALSRKIAPSDEMPAQSVAAAIETWKARESSLAIARGDSDDKLDRIHDRAEALQAVLSSSAARDAGSLRVLLEELFSKAGTPVLLSTIHRAKGLEWHSVLHLDPWRIPSKPARRAGGAALAQEYNLRYVCETRTRDLLVEANLEDWEAEPQC